MQAEFNEPVETLPAVREAIAGLPSLETLANNYKITTPAQYTTSGEDLLRVKAAQKLVEDTRTSITVPMNAALKRVNDFFRGPADRLVKVERTIKGERTGYEDEQDRIRQEQQRRADAEAQKERDRLATIARETERKAQEKAAVERKAAEEAAAAGRAEEAARLREKAQATELKAAEKASTFDERAAMVVAPVITRDLPKVSGISTRMVPKFEIIDAKLLPREYLVPDMTKIGGVVRSLRTDANIPGIRVWMEKQIAAGAA